MGATDTVYSSLAEHLDTFPGGFHATETGAEIRLLQKLFSPEEAELATELTLKRESAQEVAARTQRQPDRVAAVLEEMASRGLVFAVYSDCDPTRYQAVPLVVGIYEFQLARLDHEILAAFDEYHRAPPVRRRRPARGEIPQMRTIPVKKRIDTTLPTMPYENVDQLLQRHQRFAVAPCICRRAAGLRGHGCDSLPEACLIFDEWADYYVRNIEGRYIELDEVHQILEQAEDQGLVLQPSNSQAAAFLCCCCSCCCGILDSLKGLRRPAAAVATAFAVALDPEQCENCGVCVDRCPMDALTPGDAHVELNPNRCIGCGLCVNTCPTQALVLERRPEGQQKELPATMDATWDTIVRARASRLQQ
jgi:Na+-translocating ferredoxin:NAD+ oxidoreductase subunit B